MSPTSCQTAPPRNRGANYRRQQSGLQTGCPGACSRSLPPAVLPCAWRAGIADPLDVPLVFLLRGQVVTHLCVVARLGLEPRAEGRFRLAIERELAALLDLETRGQPLLDWYFLLVRRGLGHRRLPLGVRGRLVVGQRQVERRGCGKRDDQGSESSQHGAPSPAFS